MAAQCPCDSACSRTRLVNGCRSRSNDGWYQFVREWPAGVRSGFLATGMLTLVEYSPRTPLMPTLRPGDAAPIFTLPHKPRENVNLGEFVGKAPVVLLFFPLAFSSVC